MSFALVRPAALVATLLCALPVAAAGDAHEWLSRMEKAVQSLSYEGTFVHMVGDSVETMHVIHRSRDGEVSERLFSRDQPGREVLRQDDKVTCIFADQRTVLVERRAARRSSPLLGSVPQEGSQIDHWYEFREAGQSRKLGRTVRIIEVSPRDGYRYGHRLWLDEITAMPLKVQLLDHAGVAVEQIQFVSIVMPAEIPDARLLPSVDVEGFTWFEQDKAEATAADIQPEWTIDEPPPGFEMTESRVRTLPGSSQLVSHLVYSDGLASVSVFVEPAGDPERSLSGLSRLGAAHAFTLVQDGQQITAVGEVPPGTVEHIARAVRATGTAPN